MHVLDINIQKSCLRILKCRQYSYKPTSQFSNYARNQLAQP